MSLWSWLSGRSGPPASTAAPAAAVSPPPVPYLDARSAIGLSAVWRCVTLICDQVADMPWQEWRGIEAAELGVDPERLAPSRLVRRPQAAITRREWTWRVVALEALQSTAYLLHIGGTDSEGVPSGLLPVPTDAIFPIDAPDPWGLLPPTRYQVGDLEVDASQLTIIRRAPIPGVPEYVHGIIDLARSQFQAYLAADTQMARYWAGGGPTTTQITSDQEIDDPEADRIARRWVERRASGLPAVLGKGAKAEPFGADPTTESAVAARREIVADVGRYFGLPTRILNAPVGDTSEYANVENDAVDLLRYCLRGYMGPLEDGISELLPGDPITGRRMVLDPSRLIQGDLRSRAEAYPALVSAQILTRDEARAQGFGLPPMTAVQAASFPEPAAPADQAAEPAAIAPEV